MSHVNMSRQGRPPVPARSAAVRTFQSRRRGRGGAGAGVRAGIGVGVGPGVRLETDPHPDTPPHPTGQVRHLTGGAGQDATNPCRGFLDGEKRTYPPAEQAPGHAQTRSRPARDPQSGQKQAQRRLQGSE